MNDFVMFSSAHFVVQHLQATDERCDAKHNKKLQTFFGLFKLPEMSFSIA